jgi:hypothetical protein
LDLRLIDELMGIDPDVVFITRGDGVVPLNPAAILRDLVVRRASTSFDIVLARVAYVFTSKGLSWWQGEAAREEATDPDTADDQALIAAQQVGQQRTDAAASNCGLHASHAR